MLSSSDFDPMRKSYLAFLLPLGVSVSQHAMHAETGEKEERREIRQQKKSELPRVDFLARMDRRAIDDVRCCSGCIVGV